MTEQENPPVKYASFNMRVIAAMLDISIIMLFAVPVVNWLMELMFPPLNLGSVAGMIYQPDMTRDRLGSELVRVAQEQHVLQRAIVENLLQGLFVACYTLPFWFRYAATPGKMLLRMQIQDAATGAPISHRQAVIRFLGYFASLIPLSIGFIWAAFNKKRLTWHDRLAHTIVVVKPRKNLDHK